MKNYQKYGLIGCLIAVGVWGYGCSLEATCDENSEYADLDSDGKIICKKFDATHCGKSDKGNYVNCKEEGIPNAADFLCVYDGTTQKYQCEIKKCYKGYIKDDDGSCSDCEKGYHHPDENPSLCALNDRLDKCGFSEINCNKYIDNGRAASVECQKKWEYGAIAEFGCNMKSCMPGYHREYNELSEANECVVDSSIQCGDELINCTKDTSWSRGDCIGGKCVPSECADGWYLDEGTCVQSDNEHCGGKDIECGQGKFCIKNRCEDTCESPLTNCSGKCVDTASDVYNCGRCDNNCTQNSNLNDPNIVSVKCDNTQCVIDRCKAGFHRYGYTCEEDSNENCGEHGFACITDDFSVCYAGAPLAPAYEYQIGEENEYYIDDGSGTGSCYVKPGQVCENGICVSKNASVVIGSTEIEDPEAGGSGVVPIEK